MSTPWHHEQARRGGRVAQFAAGIMIALAVASLVFGGRAGAPEALPAQETEDARPPSIEIPSGLVEQDERRLPSIDPREEAEQAMMLFPEMVKKSQGEGDDASAENAGTDGPGATPPQDGEWEYLGAMIGPQRRLALVSIGGRQRPVAEGREIDGVRLVRVEAEFIEIDDEGEIRRIEPAPRSGSLLTTLGPASPGEANRARPSTAETGEEESPTERYRRLREERMRTLGATAVRENIDEANQRQAEARRRAREQALRGGRDSPRSLGRTDDDPDDR